MSKLRPVWVSDRFETHFGLRSKPLECSHDAGEMKLRSTWNSFRFLRSVWVFRSTWNFHVSRNFFHFGAKWIFKRIVNGIPSVPLAIKTIKISFTVSQLDLNVLKWSKLISSTIRSSLFWLPKERTHCFYSGTFLWNAHVQSKLAELKPVWKCSCEGEAN